MQETHVMVDDFIYPVFVKEGESAENVLSMPGIKRHSIAELVDECRVAHTVGIRAVALFPVDGVASSMNQHLMWRAGYA